MCLTLVLCQRPVTRTPWEYSAHCSSLTSYREEHLGSRAREQVMDTIMGVTASSILVQIPALPFISSVTLDH